ncbi:MAG TPA: septum site-determining protein Ssd [Propionibacteriaceae bacterium]|nr:septum site-determining protein Ssd [Propionibacteriaceae bacterium]
MNPKEIAEPSAVVVTSEEELLDQVLAVGAAAGVEFEAVSDVGALRSLWSGASAVVVGVDQAAAVVEKALPRRTEVYVVGLEGSRDLVQSWSVPLRAAVVLLPSGIGWLSGALADAAGSRLGSGRLLAVIGGSGGAGASTLASGLAVVAAQLGQRCLLIDADPLGGGLDLLMGAERAPGWRWPRLIGARGHLGDLAGQLPAVDGVEILAMPRHEMCDLGAEAMKAVLRSASRCYELVIVDLPRQPGAAAGEVLRQADGVVVAAVADLRGLAAGTCVVELLGDSVGLTGLVVRLPRGRSMAAETVAEGLDLPLLATIGEDVALRVGAERGDPPGRVARSSLARACRAVLEWPELASVTAA